MHIYITHVFINIYIYTVQVYNYEGGLFIGQCPDWKNLHCLSERLAPLGIMWD